MNFLKKNELFIKLQAGDHLNADRAFLIRLNPKSKILEQKFFDKDKERKEILYALLDVAEEDEIIASRSGKIIVKKASGQKVAIVKKKSKHKPRKHK